MDMISMENGIGDHFSNVAGGLGAAEESTEDVEGVKLSDRLLCCMHIFNFIYLLDGVLLVAVSLYGVFNVYLNDDQKIAAYLLIVNGAIMSVTGILACCAACCKCYNNCCIAIMYCLLTTLVIAINGYAIYAFNGGDIEAATDTSGDNTIVYLVDVFVTATWLLNAFGYASVIKTNPAARKFMKCICFCFGGGEE
ncbi:uncharacterized protein [Amphiura filiformis]|uniref:uncharacterized protein n=1 Tax=Amphiura filiformis TaxID=82378 RepID=UPI003B21E90F